jgi:hypothetical protein
MRQLAEITTREVRDVQTALEAEHWASCIVDMWHSTPLLDGDVEELFFPGFARALEARGTAAALSTLRAMSSVGADAHRRSTRAAADRLAARGVAEPAWSEQVGQARPVAAMLTYEEFFDDGLSVVVEFAAADGEAHSLGIYIDHNMGGLVKDAFLVPGGLSEVRDELGGRAGNDDGLAVRELDLAEARARVENALATLDHTFDPPVDEDARSLRALIDARLRLLPDGFTLADEFIEVEPEDRARLLSDFFSSPEGQRWHGDEDAEDVAATAIEFGCGYNHGGPLRWSPVVVEIFMTAWLAHKVAREPEFFRRVPEVLGDWVAYAGRRRGVPAAPLREATAMVKRCRKEMLEAADDPEAWGPAKTFAIAAQQAGVDMREPEAIGKFIDRFNEGLAA